MSASVRAAAPGGREGLTRANRRSIFGNAYAQVDEVCEQIRQDAKLAAGYNVVGLSQGSLLLRGVLERCADRPDQPPMKNLILAGGPNMGIMELPGAACPQPENLHPLFLKVACVVAQHALSLTTYHVSTRGRAGRGRGLTGNQDPRPGAACNAGAVLPRHVVATRVHNVQKGQPVPRGPEQRDGVEKP